MREQATYARALGRAAEIAGGVEALAAKLGVTPILLRSWINRSQEVPVAIFLTVVDLLMDNELGQMRKVEGHAPAEVSPPGKSTGIGDA